MYNGIICENGICALRISLRFFNGVGVNLFLYLILILIIFKSLNITSEITFFKNRKKKAKKARKPGKQEKIKTKREKKGVWHQIFAFFFARLICI